MRERLDRLAKLLPDQVENLVLLNHVDSTHAMARRLIAGMDEEDQSLRATVIIADHQESGEGRGDRKWVSPTGGLYLSWMQSGIDSDTIAKLPMLAAAAALSAISTVGVREARIKWPNDIIVAGKKLAGMVVFARHGETNWATVGLGVNIDTTPVLEETNGVQAVSIADVANGGDPEACMRDPDQRLRHLVDPIAHRPGARPDRLARQPIAAARRHGARATGFSQGGVRDAD